MGSLKDIRADAVMMRGFLRAGVTQATKVIDGIDAITAPAPARPAGIWTSPAELAALPMTGPAWEAMEAYANRAYPPPDLAHQDEPTNTATLARALIYARTGGAAYREMVVEALAVVSGRERYVGRALALGRNLAAYVIAADLIGLSKIHPTLDTLFRAQLRYLRTVPTEGAAKNLIDSHERRPNNWGTMAGASRIAVALYLDDTEDLDRAATVFRGYLGERDAYAFEIDDFGGEFGKEDHSWEHDPSAPVGVNPRGSQKDGLSIDGVMPDDQRRSGPYAGKATRVNYSWEALQGSTVQAALLTRAGYPAWTWGDHALLRAITWLHDMADYPAVGDDRWITWLANAHLGTDFPAETPTNPGKVMGWTDWSHA